MKLITAIVQPSLLAEVIDAVVASGAHGLTSSEVHGFGQQYGRQSAHEQAHWGPGPQAALLPKARVEFSIFYRDHLITLGIVDHMVRVSSGPGSHPPIRVGCRGQLRDLSRGQSLAFPI